MSDRKKNERPLLTIDDLVFINERLAQDKVIVLFPKRDSVAITVQTNKLERTVTSSGTR